MHMHIMHFSLEVYMHTNHSSKSQRGDRFHDALFMSGKSIHRHKGLYSGVTVLRTVTGSNEVYARIQKRWWYTLEEWP